MNDILLAITHTQDKEFIARYYAEHPEERNTPSIIGLPPIMHAISLEPVEKAIDMVDFLAGLGCDVNAATSTAWFDNPIRRAAVAAEKDFRLLECLHRNGADWEMLDNKKSWFGYDCREAVQKRLHQFRVERVRESGFAREWFIDGDGLPTRFLQDAIGEGFLHLLCDLNLKTVALYFEECHALRKEPSVRGVGAIHAALKSKSPDRLGMAQQLAAFGCDPNVVEKEVGAFCTAMHYAASELNMLMLRWLDTQEANWFIENHLTFTPLQIMGPGTMAYSQTQHMMERSKRRADRLPFLGYIDSANRPTRLINKAFAADTKERFTPQAWRGELQKGSDLYDEIVARLAWNKAAQELFIEMADIGPLKRALENDVGSNVLKALARRPDGRSI